MITSSWTSGQEMNVMKGPRMVFSETDGGEEYMCLGDRDDRKQLNMHQKLITLSGGTLACCTRGPRFSLENS